MAIQIRRGTDAEWESNKSNIVAGEPAVAMDTERMFIGTGSGTFMEVANIDVLADAFDSSASYVVGDFVSYHGRVYKFTSTHSGAWNASDVEEVALADALDALGDDVYTKAETDAMLALKADASDVLSALALKADKSDTYTKTEVNTALDLKADKSNTYTKTQVDTALNLKSDKDDTYTKAQVDAIAEQIIRETEYSNFEMKSVSGDFVHITDGAGLIPVKDLKIGIDAVQDLHGYDAPWVGGAGKNILPLEVDIIKSQNTDGTWNGNAYSLNGVTFTILVDSDGNVIGINVNGTASDATIFVVNNSFRDKLAENTEYMLSGSPTNPDVTKWKLRLYMSADWIDAGNGRTFEFIPLAADCKVEIVVYSGTAMSNVLFKPMICLSSASDPLVFAPYANICPISGWAGAKVTVCGVNLFNKNGTLNDGYLLADGTNASSGSYYYTDYIKVFPNTEYHFHGTSGANPSICWYDSNKSFISGVKNNGIAERVLTSPNNAMYVRASFARTDLNIFMVCQSSLWTGEYIPYNGKTYSVTWQTEAGTVYGGTLDVTTGELTVNWGEIDLGDLNWIYNSNWGGYSAFYSTDINLPYVSDEKIPHAISSQYIVKSRNTVYASGNTALCYSGSDMNHRYVTIRDNRYSDKDTFKTAMDGVQLAYELATPQTYQLTPTEVLTLLGENNILANTGVIEELIYRISRQ